MLTRRAQGGERLLLLLLDGDENPLVLGARALVLGRFRGHVRRSEILQLDVVKRTAPAVFWLNAALNRVSWRTLIWTEFRSHMLTEEALVVSCCLGKSPGKMPISEIFIAKFPSYRVSWSTACWGRGFMADYSSGKISWSAALS